MAVAKNKERPFQLLIDGSVLGTALAQPAATVTRPSGSGVADVGGRTLGRLLFGGAGSANDTINYQVIFIDIRFHCLIIAKKTTSSQLSSFLSFINFSFCFKSSSNSLFSKFKFNVFTMS